MSNKKQDKPDKFNANKPYAIICEGMDEFLFLIHYLNYLEIHEVDKFQDCHHVMNFGGIDDLKNKLKMIKSFPNYQTVKGILIVRDAEKDAKAACNSLIDIIQQIWGVKIDSDGTIKISDDDIKIGFFLLPGFDDSGNYRNGTLEDLCLEILNPMEKENISVDNILTSVNKYLNTIIAMRKKEMTMPHKNQLHLFFSSTDKFVSAKIGEAAKYGAFDFSHPKLNSLKEMILQMQD